MTRRAARSRCLALPGAVEQFPFGPQTAVFKVGGKIFAILAGDESPARLSLKCDPELALGLREAHAAVTPGYHLDKRHWNTIVCDGSLPDAEVEGLVEHSYELIVEALPATRRRSLGL